MRFIPKHILQIVSREGRGGIGGCVIHSGHFQHFCLQILEGEGKDFIMTPQYQVEAVS